MSPAPATERRAHQRHPLSTSVQFYHGPSQREFPCRSADVSQGGVRMYVPAATPVRPGDSVRLALGSMSRPEFAALGDKPVDSTVVRVNRDAMIERGYIEVAVRFLGA